ncbi:branched chain amino acid aminotransferase apoenzyme [Geoalkalibacter ferrihydriticus]|uniref:branched-chain-amino-acid transaminase n=2 Tax=Geoalkalibacter ferrihydriticus TaxID=392333 RepID=A0A0C2EBV3_9BACT|nr:branched-chain amino acid aminotransferase [Geoalkalibacter ferrihydriticus]KIH76053.1 branched-chain amino acid aminotransferase [Geoalkalibacter ferrihydriticus DSM 17813]SDM47939.1 branched chain amino acid aminotransferase apoenzyme [Geoalkalibacter ferrihydriticus]
MELSILPLTQPKARPRDENALAFGKTFSDRMFVMEYATAKGWHGARIAPYGPFSLDPAAAVLHYAQEIFEGLKAFRCQDGRIALFRPTDNVKRFNRSADRMCMPRVDEAFFLQAIKELVRLEADWVPRSEGTSLYIRPTMIATDPYLGVRPSDTYLCYVILSPVAAYYKGGFSPVKIWISDEFVRSAPGGTGEAKTGGNYAASLRASMEAAKLGFDQVLWLDAVHRKYVEEVGSMNICFYLDGKVVTSPLKGTILDGITRRSVLTLIRDLGIEVEERALSVEEIMEGAASGRLVEAFGTGTAAVVSPVGQLTYRDRTIEIGGNQVGALTLKLYETLTGIQYGRLPDPHGWVEKI